MNKGKQESDAQRAGAARNKEQGDRGEGKINTARGGGGRREGRKAPGEVVIARKMAAVGHTGVGGWGG